MLSINQYKNLYQHTRFTITKLCCLLSAVVCFSSFSEETSPQQSVLFYTLDFATQDYALEDISDYFFTTYPHDDPTEGDVVYDRKQWKNDDMLELKSKDGLYLYVKDRKDKKAFDSVRMTSKAFYNLHDDNDALLFVYKGEMPSIKGVWPAWWLNGGLMPEWTYDEADKRLEDNDLDKYSGKGHFYNTSSEVNSPDWPLAGEIDLIETINGENIIHNTLHTCPQMYDSRWNSAPEVINCANGKPSDPNAGCSGAPYEVESPRGTFAVIWQKQKLQFFYWTPEEDVRKSGGPLSQNPDPSSWKAGNLKNQAQLLATNAQCDASVHKQWQCDACTNAKNAEFTNMKMIFNITLCGKWAGLKFDETPNALKNCQDFIFNQGAEAIDNQYIKIEYLSVRKLH